MPSPDNLPGASDPRARPAAGTAVEAYGYGHRAGNGHRPPTDGPAPLPGRRPPGPSTKPALIVVGIIFVLFLLGICLELVSGSQSRPTASPQKLATAPGAVLDAAPARPLLHSVISSGQPPDDLLNALAVPKGATPVANSATSRGVELYDRSLRFDVTATQRDVISFFRAQLPAQHWRKLSQGPTGASGAYLILEQHPASDGHEWDLGVTVSPTSFGPRTPGSDPQASSQTSRASASTPASASTVANTGTTPFTLRLYSVSDQD